MLERFSKVSDLNIIVLGDIILDEYINGSITRMSAEAPIPIVDKNDMHHVLGGSANVAANLKSLGAQPILVGMIGDDQHGSIIKNKLEDHNIPTADIITADKATCVKSRVMVDDKQVFRLDSEDSSDISKSTEDQILDILISIVEKQTIVGIILQDYNKGIFTPSMITQVISLAKRKGIKIFVDPKFDNYWEYKSVDYFKPNKGELYKSLSDDSLSIEKAIKETRTKLNCDHVICTLAEEGMAMQSDSGYIHNPTKKIDLIDVSGAGDSTLAMITIAALLGYSQEEILLLSNATGRAACCKLGVSVVTLDDVRTHL